jgi:hypothetical protein
LEAKFEDIPSVEELKEFRRKDLSKVLAEFPKGTVLGLTQKEAAVPEGWSVCDGTKGTPNLTGKFLVGVSSKSNIGVTGGSTNISNAGSHSHQGTTGNTKGPDHGVPCSGNCAGGRTGNHNHSFTTSGDGEHNHGDNRPPFYATLFICKI